MSRRRRSIRRPPTSAEYVVGEMYEFNPEDDLVNAGKPIPPPVELTPSGPPVAAYEFEPGDDCANSPAPVGRGGHTRSEPMVHGSCSTTEPAIDEWWD
jgi:hypothetical protein